MDELQELKNQKKEIDEKMKDLRLEKMENNSKNHSSNSLIRVSNNFDNEVVDIIKERNAEKKDKMSKPEVTNLIVKHNLWSKIKLDILNFVYDKKGRMNHKGQMTFFFFLIIVGVLAISIMLLVGGITTVKINEALDQNISLGQVNLADLNADTFGVVATTYINSADWWGIAAIFGMILGLFLSSYMLRNKFPKIGIILDILIIVAAFLFSTYISSTYRILLDSLASAGETFLEVYTPKTSLFILNLPIFSVIIGVIMMILFHSSIPNKPEERAMSGGSLQGVQ